MAHAGTPSDLAKQPATSTFNGLWQALLVAAVLLALVVGMVFIGTNLAAKRFASPAADRSYDEIQRSAISFAPATDRSYDQIEAQRSTINLAPAAHYPDVSYEQNRVVTPRTRFSGTAPDNRPARTKGHIGAMVAQ